MIEFHKKWITNSCLIIKENCQKINMLDQEIGDGDHGTTILRGLEEAVSHFRANNEFDNSISFMNEISKLMRISMGGASGILMTIFFKELGNLNFNDLYNTILITFSNTINKIKTRGKVNFGDKSFLDIYVPIHQELIQNNLIDFDKIITKIDESLEYTKSLEARVGRAKFLDSKGVGVIDPGAYSTSIILKEFFKEINNEKNN